MRPPHRTQARPLCILSLGLMLIAASTFAGLWFPKMLHDKIIDASIGESFAVLLPFLGGVALFEEKLTVLTPSPRVNPPFSLISRSLLDD